MLQETNEQLFNTQTRSAPQRLKIVDGRAEAKIFSVGDTNGGGCKKFLPPKSSIQSYTNLNLPSGRSREGENRTRSFDTSTAYDLRNSQLEIPPDTMLYNSLLFLDSLETNINSLNSPVPFGTPQTNQDLSNVDSGGRVALCASVSPDSQDQEFKLLADIMKLSCEQNYETLRGGAAISGKSLTDTSGSGSSKNALRNSAAGNRFFKTRRCLFHQKGACVKGDQCTYAHDDVELHPTPDLIKTRLCQDWLNNKCETKNCRFAHGRHELRFTHDFYKTRICHFWQQGGCTKGSLCRHAHGQHEIRMLPPSANEARALPDSLLHGNAGGAEDFPSRGSTRSTSSPSPTWGCADHNRIVDGFPAPLAAADNLYALNSAGKSNPDVLEALRLAHEAKKLAEKSAGLLQRAGDLGAFAPLLEGTRTSPYRYTTGGIQGKPCHPYCGSGPFVAQKHQAGSDLTIEGLTERLLTLL